VSSISMLGFLTKEIMKNFILILALFLSNLVASQVTINDGYINSLGNYVELSVTTLDRKFVWTDDGNVDLLVCFIYDHPDSLPANILKWDVVKVVTDSEGKYYHVRNKDNKDFLITFMKHDHMVFILNVDSKAFSAMYGKSLDYKKV